jgi:ketosteroid isomerase-like protein
MRPVVLLLLSAFVMLSGGPAMTQAGGDLTAQVRESERAFAQTMATRDYGAFGSFVSEEAVFFDGQSATRGRTAVLAAWKGFFDGAAAPFSWEPQVVEVLDSGTLALSSGPVRNPQGQQVGTFNSIWRRESGDRWRVIFDKGAPVCPPARGR